MGIRVYGLTAPDVNFSSFGFEVEGIGFRDSGLGFRV